MEITIDQARALVALAQYRTYQKAAGSLGKGHSAIVYAIQGLETALGAPVIDRRRYRSKLTPLGERVLSECYRLIDSANQISRLSQHLQEGWEPLLKVVYDGVLSSEILLGAVQKILRQKLPTRIEVYTDFLNGVQEEFEAIEANMMISIVPPQNLELEQYPLPPIPAMLVAARGHPLLRQAGVLTQDQLQEEVLLSVRGSDPRLGLSTQDWESQSHFYLNDFYAKKTAILMGIGYGWLPLYLIEKELKSGQIQLINTEIVNHHDFHPVLYTRKSEILGRAAKKMIQLLCDNPSRS